MAGLVVLLGAASATVWVVRSLSLRTDADARRRLAGRRPAPTSLNLVLVTLDTLRADRLHCYGFPDIETPNIDAIANDGVLFEQVTATAPMTLPSHATILTGLIPPHHGVRDNGGFFLDEAKTTLAERLKQAGFATGAFVGAWVLESRWGIGQGFDTYNDRFDLSKYKVVSLGTVQKKGDEVMDSALAWLETVRSKRFFAWIHLYDPHAPYEPPEPFASRYPRQKYLGEIAYTDHVVGRLRSWLKQTSLQDRTVVALVGDHGESLGEHGESAHTFFIYDATMHVPLIVRTPWGDRGRCRTQVSTADLAPTLLDLLGLPPFQESDGRSLLRMVMKPSSGTDEIAYSETYFPRFHFGWQHLRSLRNGSWKFIDAPQPELYDVTVDPHEAKNLFKANSRRGEDMRLALTRLAGGGAQAAPDKENLDPETLQRLAALGYVGAGPQVDPEAILPDPKEKIRLVARMGNARSLAQDERFADAVAAMREVIAEDPAIIDAHVAVGGWLRHLHQTDEAIAAFKRALALKPDHEIALNELANIYRAQGHADAAIEGYRTVLRIEPRKPQVWYQLATLYVDLGRIDEAVLTFREALKHNPKMGAAYNSLAAIAFGRGDYLEAERLVRKGLDLEDDLRGSRFNLGRLFEARGDSTGAERLYREELGTFPDNGRAHFNLAQLLRQRGDQNGFLSELRASVDQAAEFGPAFFFLAREELKAGHLDRAADLAQRGLKVDRFNEFAPLGHYVLADIATRRGQMAEAQRQVADARKLQETLRRRPPSPF